MPAAVYPITFTLSNIIKIIAFMSPFLLSFTMLLFSILNNKILPGLILLVGIVIVTFINYLLKNIIKSEQQNDASPFCNVLPFPFTYNSNESVFDSPSLSIMVLSFILSYITFPMFNNVNGEKNFTVLVFSIILIIVNAIVEYHDKCSGAQGLILGIITGLIMGVLYYNLISSNDKNNNLTYFTDITSNKTKCGKPNEKKFRCRRYVRGEQTRRGYNPGLPSSDTTTPSTTAESEPPIASSQIKMERTYGSISGTFWKIITSVSGEQGRAEATLISDILKCNPPIESYHRDALTHMYDYNPTNGNEFIIDCSGATFVPARSVEPRFNIRSTYLDFISSSTNDNTNIMWNYHSDQCANILAAYDMPQLDLINLTGQNNRPSPYYLIPGAGKQKVCDFFATKLGCAACDNSLATTVGIASGQIWQNISGTAMSNNFNLSDEIGEKRFIDDPNTAGWGITKCPAVPATDPTSGFKVFINDSKDYPEKDTYGRHGDISDSRIAYWFNVDDDLEVDIGLR